MKIWKRLLLSAFGFLSGLVGFLSLIAAIMIILLPFVDIEGQNKGILMSVFMIIFGEIFLAFGIAASLLSLRYIWGPKDWIIRVINYFWARAVKFAFIMAYISIGCAVIAWIIKFLTSFGIIQF